MLKPPAAWFLGEICVANQDLILLVDGSGSLKEDGFAILRTFAANLTNKTYWCRGPKSRRRSDTPKSAAIEEVAGSAVEAGLFSPVLKPSWPFCRA